MQSADVAIVGGGVVGAACAYYLSNQGASVVLMEQDAIAKGASGHGPGFFNAFGGDFVPGAHLSLGVASIELIREARETLNSVADGDQWWNEQPDLTLAFSEEEADRLQRLHDDSRGQLDGGIETRRWMSGSEITEREPAIAPSVWGGYFGESVLQIDGYKLAHLFAKAAEEQGATTIYGGASGLRLVGGRAEGVTLSDTSQVTCGNVVLAMGAWSPLASIWTGYPIPICGLRGQLHVLRAPKHRLSHHIIERVALMQYPNGLFLLGATPDPAPGGGLRPPAEYIRPLAETAPDPADTEHLFQIGRDHYPFLKEAQVVKDLSGVRPMSPDLMPILGRVPTLDNVYLASGHGRKGIHLSAGTGQLISDLITNGKTDLIPDPEALSPSRFMPPVL